MCKTIIQLPKPGTEFLLIMNSLNANLNAHASRFGLAGEVKKQILSQIDFFYRSRMDMSQDHI